MMEAWKRDPTSVHASWAAYFTNLSQGATAGSGAFAPPPNNSIQSSSAQPSQVLTAPSDSLGVAHLIRAYQFNGHRKARLDPLDLHTKASFPWGARSADEQLDFRYHGFTEADLDRKLNLKGNSSGGHKGFLEELAQSPQVTLRQVVEQLERTYCSTLGVEYMHISDNEKCNWIRGKVERPEWQTYSKDKTMHIFERLCFTDTFETFLAGKFNTTKRFGLDGGEAVVPALKAAIDRASENHKVHR